MTLQRERRRFTPEEYLLLEERGTVKSEFLDGEIFAMSGGTLAHNRLVRNLLSALDARLQDKGCEVFPSDLRLYVKRFKLFTYPDLQVVCGPPRLYPGRRDTLTDATLIVEVLSPSTQDYDRGEKFRLYRALGSFQEYLLVSQDEVRAEQHRRQGPGRWLMTEVTDPAGEVELTSLGVTLPLSAVYRGVLA